MLIEFTEKTKLLKEPKDDGAFIDDVGPFKTIKSVEKLSESEDKTWFEVKVKFLGSTLTGWARAEVTKPADPKDIPPIRPWAFLKNCTIATRVTNAMHRKKPDADPAYGVNRDYLLAWAWLATKHPKEETDEKADELYWTFNLRQDEWQAFVDDAEANNSGFTADDFADPATDISYQVYQCYAAAYIAYRDHMALSKAVTATLPPEKASGPYIPNSIELLLAHLAGVKVATALAAIDPTKNIAEALALPDIGAETAERIKAFLASHQITAATIAEAVKAVETLLDNAFQKTRDLLLKYTPEDVSVVANKDEVPPWMVVAHQELEKGISEDKKETVPRIIEYFTATGFPTKTMAPWCGAFVSWCLKNCGNEAVAGSVKTALAARAASWRDWGTTTLPQRSDDIPVGAVVVLARSEKGDGSGHVGFFVRRGGGTITLLGGNQSDKIMEKPFADSKIVAIRWLNWNGDDGVADDDAEPGTAIEPEAPSGSAGQAFGPFSDADWEKYKNVLGKRESGNKYTSVNQIGFVGRWQLGAPALIDLGYVRRGTSTRHLKVGGWTGKDGIASRADFLANKGGVQDKVILAYTKMNYKTLLRIRALHPSDKKTTVAGGLAAAHLTGPGGAKLLLKSGVSAKDGNGVPSSSYFGLLSKAIG